MAKAMVIKTCMKQALLLLEMVKSEMQARKTTEILMKTTGKKQATILMETQLNDNKRTVKRQAHYHDPRITVAKSRVNQATMTDLSIKTSSRLAHLLEKLLHWRQVKQWSPQHTTKPVMTVAKTTENPVKTRRVLKQAQLLSKMTTTEMPARMTTEMPMRAWRLKQSKMEMIIRPTKARFIRSSRKNRQAIRRQVIIPIMSLLTIIWISKLPKWTVKREFNRITHATSRPWSQKQLAVVRSWQRKKSTPNQSTKQIFRRWRRISRPNLKTNPQRRN